LPPAASFVILSCPSFASATIEIAPMSSFGSARRPLSFALPSPMVTPATSRFSVPLAFVALP
jgi:hypothetical protein